MEIKLVNKPTRNIAKTPILQQSTFWSEVKRRQGFESKAFDMKVGDDDLHGSAGRQQNVTDDILLLFQEIGDGFTIGYVPYGPTLKPVEENRGLFLEELSESLRPYLPEKCIMLRYDLLWESPWIKDEFRFDPEKQWAGLPAKQNQEIILNFDTQNHNLRKANTNILPSDTIFIDLRKKEDDLLSAMKSKTRYNIRLSARKGIQVMKEDFSNLDTWYQLYRETCARNHIYLHDIRYFKTLLETKDSKAASTSDIELLVARFDGRPLAAMFLAYSDRRASYLYGASSSKGRQLMPTYALQWEAIKRAKIRGCTEYDMFGIAPVPDPAHPLYGLYRFKKGFGGRVFHRMGCWDYPLNGKIYDLYLSAEMKSQGYHLN